MPVDEKRISKIQLKIDAGKFLSKNDILCYEQFVFQQNNFSYSHVFGTSDSATKLYVDAKNGLFYSTPQDPSEYAFQIYSKNQIADLEKKICSTIPEKTSNAKAIGTALGGIVGGILAEEYSTPKLFVDFGGLIIQFNDGSQKIINFISRTKPLKYESRKYNKVVNVVFDAYDLLLKTSPFLPIENDSNVVKQNKSSCTRESIQPLSKDVLKSIVKNLVKQPHEEALARISELQVTSADKDIIQTTYDKIYQKYYGN